LKKKKASMEEAIFTLEEANPSQEEAKPLTGRSQSHHWKK
jgi:hypothetical protein